jgi:hypothetical protein
MCRSFASRAFGHAGILCELNKRRRGKAKRLRAGREAFFRRDAVGLPGRRPGSDQGSTGVNPRSNGIDASDDTGKADACHYELPGATRISQHLVVVRSHPPSQSLGGLAGRGRDICPDCRGTSLDGSQRVTCAGTGVVATASGA